MMVVRAIQALGVQRDAGIHREGLKPFLHQLSVEFADLVAHEFGLEHQERAAGNVDGDAGQRLVHRHVHVGVAGDALHVAERLLHRLAKRDAGVLGGVMKIDVQIAFRLHCDVDARVARQQIEHVVEEADARRNIRRALAVEIDRDLDIGLFRLALHCAFAHPPPLNSRAFYQGLRGFATWLPLPARGRGSG
jgi:propanediol utilization protein